MGNTYPSWKGKLKRVEPLPLDPKLRLSVAQHKVKTVLENLQQIEGETWESLLDFRGGEERFKSQVGDEVSFKDYSTTHDGAVVSRDVTGAIFESRLSGLNDLNFPVNPSSMSLQPTASLIPVPPSSPSWKEKLKRGEPVPLDLELTEEVLLKMGIGRPEAPSVLDDLQRHKRRTWGALLIFLMEGEEVVKKEVGDVVSANVLWEFLRSYNAKSGSMSPQPLTSFIPVLNSSPSWKEKMKRGEPLPLDLELTEEVLLKMGIGRPEAPGVLEDLQRHKRRTWGALLILLKEGGEVVKKEVGDVVSANVLWEFLRSYNAKRNGGPVVPSTRDVNVPTLPSFETPDSMSPQQPTASFIPVPPSSPSWKEKMKHREPLPFHLKLTRKVLRKMGIGKREATGVLEDLQRYKRKTWGDLLMLFNEGEEGIKREVGDVVSANVMWEFLKSYNPTTNDGPVVPPVLDVTETILTLLLQDLGGFPSPQQLNLMLQQPVAPYIPVPNRLAKALFNKATVNQTFTGKIGCIRASDTEETSLEYIFHELLLVGGLKDVINPRTAYRLHQVYDTCFDQLLRNLLEFKKVRHCIVRNDSKERPDPTATVTSGTKRPCSSRDENSLCRKKSKATSGKAIPSGKFRPDLHVMVNGLLFLRGKEKLHGVPWNEAEDDLVRNTVWCPAVLGRLPYALAYIACGEKFRLYAMQPVPSSYRVTLTRLGWELDLTKTSDALELVGYVIHVARVLVQAHSEPESSQVPPIGHVWEKVSDEYSKITIHETYVEKCLLENDGGRTQWDGPGGLEELYDLIDAGKITGTSRLKDVIRSRSRKRNEDISITLLLKPLGYRVRPLLDELENFLCDVLAALHSMHEHGWVHRDVKLGNVVKRTDGHWMLIDLEYAAKLDDAKSADWPWFDRPGYPMPKRKDEKERWRPEHDVKQVKIMLRQLKCFEQHPHQLDIVNVLKAAESANVMDRIRPLFRMCV